MRLKLERGTVYKVHQFSKDKLKGPKKRIRFDRPWTNPISTVEILKSFGITSLIFVNAAILCLAIVWFGLLFTIVTPLELVDMMLDTIESDIVISPAQVDVPLVSKISN
ncbi:MAG: hypothetical protein AAF902_11110 [Chloroflexota bacterium]